MLPGDGLLLVLPICANSSLLGLNHIYTEDWSPPRAECSMWQLWLRVIKFGLLKISVVYASLHTNFLLFTWLKLLKTPLVSVLLRC